jgi:Kef-type K+ transport system membrane component KefB
MGQRLPESGYRAKADGVGLAGAGVNFGTLALICAAAVLGPLLALPRAWHIPVVAGELGAGILLGPTAANLVHAHDPVLTFLADIGFALIMFVAGTHVPIRDRSLRAALPVGAVRAAAVGVLALVLAYGIARLFGTGHAPVYAVLMASSSAALVLPIIDSLHLAGPPILRLIPQVAIADAVSIVALPLAIDLHHVARAALGALAITTSAALLFVVLRYLERSGIRKRVHRVSEARKFALELRVHLIILFSLAALAVRTHVSVMLAGFGFGLAVGAVGEPRRVARQLFALTDGFLGPLFFVWLGASLDLRELGRHPALILLGLALGVGAVVVHAAMALSGQPLPVATLAAAQLGVPVAAATLGAQLHLLRPGEPAALMLGALVTIVVAVLAGGRAAKAGPVHPPDQLPADGPLGRRDQ